MARIDSPHEASQVLSWIAEHKDKPGVDIGYDGRKLEIYSPSGKATYTIAKEEQACFAIKLNEVTNDVPEHIFAGLGIDSTGHALKDAEGAIGRTTRGLERMGRGDIGGILGGARDILGGVTKGMGVGTPALSCTAVEVYDLPDTPNVPPPPGARGQRK